MTVKEILEHPASLIAGLLGAVGIAVNPGVFVAFAMTIWTSAGTLFTGLSILSFTVAPNVEALTPYAGMLQSAALIAAGVFLVKLAEQTHDNFEDRL